MKDILLRDNFHFNHFRFERYRHTDNRGGAPYHYLAYMETGRCRLVGKHTTVALQGGDVFYIPEGESYESYWEGNPEIRFLSFGFHRFPENDGNCYPMQKITCDGELRERLQAIPTHQPTDSFLIGAFYGLLSQMLPFMQGEPRHPRRAVVEAARSFWLSTPGATVAQAARQLLLSESALYDAFRSETAITPNEFRLQVLCEKAVSLLTTTDRSVQEISDELQFSSTSYFRKILHKQLGKTPREIRRSAQTV